MSMITAERRALLRHLKADFDEAFEKLDNPDDRSSAVYRVAEEAYKMWRRAIDADALALLDDLEEMEAENERLRRENFDYAPASPIPDPSAPMPQAEIEKVFQDIDRMVMLQEAINLPE